MTEAALVLLLLSAAAAEGNAATSHARGEFDVKLTQQASDESGGTTLGRASVEKTFRGDIVGTSKGEMLSAITAVQGSASYVAFERVAGSLQGRTGTFVLQHSATMTRGTPHLTIVVVPDSGSGELVGLTGKMELILAEGKHGYDFEYTLPQR